MNDKSPGDKQRPSPATASQKPDAPMRAIGAALCLIGPVTTAMTLLVVATFDPTDAWWDVLLFGALSMLFVITGIGVWRMKEWGVILFAIILGVPALANVSFALVRHYYDVVGLIGHTIFVIFLFRGIRWMWKTVKAQ